MAMNQKEKKEYFGLTQKVVIPKDAGENNIDYAATVSANFASVGFPMTKDMEKELAKATKEDIHEFYTSTYDILRESYSGKLDHAKPFYPNFPEEVMEKSRAEIFIDQVVYGLSGLTIEPSLYEQRKEDFPFVGKPVVHVLQAGSEENYKKSMDHIVNTPTPYSEQMLGAVQEFVKTHPDYVPDGEMKNRENEFSFSFMKEQITGRDAVVPKTATDVLRYSLAVAYMRGNRDDRDAVINALKRSRDSINTNHLPADTRLSRSERRKITGMLDEVSGGSSKNLASDMNRHQELWKGMIRKLHVQDFDKKGTVKEAVRYVSTGKTFDRPERRIEESIKHGDLEGAVEALKSRPGQFIRRYDKLMRMAVKQDREYGDTESRDLVVRALADNAKTAGINTLYSLKPLLKDRNKDDTERTFRLADGRKVRTTDKNRKALPQEYIDKSVDVIDVVMTARYAGKEEMGKVYISPALANEAMPAQIREEKGSLDTQNKGSVSPIPDGDFMRMSVRWTNLYDGYDKRVDIDLSGLAVMKDGRTQSIGWNTNYERGYAVYSGDVRDGKNPDGEGSVEYIDIDVKKAREAGVVAFIPDINSFTGQKFDEMPHVSFECQVRNREDEGRLFEPGTVQSAFEVSGDCTSIRPFKIDVEHNTLLWMNERGQQNVATQEYRETSKDLSYVENHSFSDKYSVAYLNARANGTDIVSDPAQADTIIASSEDAIKYADSGKNVLNLSGDRAVEAMMLKSLDAVPDEYTRDVDRMVDAVISGEVSGRMQNDIDRRTGETLETGKTEFSPERAESDAYRETFEDIVNGLDQMAAEYSENADSEHNDRSSGDEYDYGDEEYEYDDCELDEYDEDEGKEQPSVRDSYDDWEL